MSIFWFLVLFLTRQVEAVIFYRNFDGNLHITIISVVNYSCTTLFGSVLRRWQGPHVITVELI